MEPPEQDHDLKSPTALARGMRLRAPRRHNVPWRILVPLFITLTGAALTGYAWLTEQEQIRENRERLLRATVRSNVSAIAARVRRNVTDLRELAKYWQLYGLGDRAAWRFDVSLFLDEHRGISWISWVGRDSSDFRVAAQDTTVVPDTVVVAMARESVHQPAGTEISSIESESGFFVSVPVRTPEDSVGVLFAGLRADSIIIATSGPLQSILALEVRSPGGRRICSIGTPAAESPEWMIVQENLESPTGETWILEYRPTTAYFDFDRSHTSQFFLWAGILLSAALGALAFQFMRLREFSKALTGANRELDYRLRELSRADERLRESNIQLEKNVQQRTAQLNEAVEEISAFGHSISHDLRSPIGAIMNFAAVLEEDYGERLNGEGMRILGRIRNSGQTATYLLDRLVQYLWAGRKEPERTQLDMNEVARAAWAEARSGDAAAAGVEFEMGTLPAAHGDPELLHRVFVNLFGNALKYTRNREERHIEVTGFQEDGWCTYAVADDGVGFQPEDGQHLFQPFRRLHGSKSFEGSGLGLAITAKIVRRHGGKVWAESDGIRGARFFFTLPCAEDGVT